MVKIFFYANFVSFRLIKFAVKRCYHKFDVYILFEGKSIISRNLGLACVQISISSLV